MLPVLALLDFSQFVVETNACDTGVGALLLLLLQQGHSIGYAGDPPKDASYSKPSIPAQLVAIQVFPSPDSARYPGLLEPLPAPKQFW